MTSYYRRAEERRVFTAREAGARLLVSYLHSHLLRLLLRSVPSFSQSLLMGS